MLLILSYVYWNDFKFSRERVKFECFVAFEKSCPEIEAGMILFRLGFCSHGDKQWIARHCFCNIVEQRIREARSLRASVGKQISVTLWNVHLLIKLCRTVLNSYYFCPQQPKPLWEYIFPLINYYFQLVEPLHWNHLPWLHWNG